MRKEGFTLIELMIVVAIIAIIAAIAIPNLITSKIAAQETSAVSGLRTLNSVEATWMQTDPDSSGKDFWTYDVSCFYRIRQANPFIDISFAKADAAPGADDFLGSQPVLYDFSSISTSGKSGYWFQALDADYSTGATVTYNVQTVGANSVAAANKNYYGFMAAPDAYGTSGVRSFIINQAGTVYACDTGSTANKWKTTAALTLQWPDSNPEGVNGPAGAGKAWRIAD